MCLQYQTDFTTLTDPSSFSQTRLTAELAESRESVQKHALRIIFGGSSFTNSSYLFVIL